jgi:hypothetical protein
LLYHSLVLQELEEVVVVEGVLQVDIEVLAGSAVYLATTGLSVHKIGLTLIIRLLLEKGGRQEIAHKTVLGKHVLLLSVRDVRHFKVQYIILFPMERFTFALQKRHHNQMGL